MHSPLFIPLPQYAIISVATLHGFPHQQNTTLYSYGSRQVLRLNNYFVYCILSSESKGGIGSKWEKKETAEHGELIILPCCEICVGGGAENGTCGDLQETSNTKKATNC